MIFAPSKSPEDPASVTWLVRRVTTDKLERALSALSGEGWHLDFPTYQGGRDWALVGWREAEPVGAQSSVSGGAR